MKLASRSVMWRAWVLMVGLGSASASADPITFGIGAGVREQVLRQDLKATPEATPLVDPVDTSASVSVVVGYRVLPWLALGGRVGVGRIDVQKQFSEHSGFTDSDGYIRMPVDVAAVAQMEWERLWIAPWTGIQAMHEVDQNRSTFDDRNMTTTTSDLRSAWTAHWAFGVTTGVDVYQHGKDRAALYVDVEHSTAGYSAVTFGAAYRR